MDDRLNRRAEDACLNAWPALKNILYDGWLLRFSEGHTRRANSVNVLGAGREPFAHKVACCERLYRAQGLPTCCRIRSSNDPALDRMLAAHGYRAEDETRTLYRHFPFSPPAPGEDVEITEGGIPQDWLRAQARFAARPLVRNDIRRRLLDLVGLPVAFAARCDGQGRIVSVAYGALHDGLVSLQWVVTDPAARGQGHARANLSALMHWAARNGAQGACLQVIAANAPAIRLYEGLGFARELYRYHYRVH